MDGIASQVILPLEMALSVPEAILAKEAFPPVWTAVHRGAEGKAFAKVMAKLGSAMAPVPATIVKRMCWFCPLTDVTEAPVPHPVRVMWLMVCAVPCVPKVKVAWTAPETVTGTAYFSKEELSLSVQFEPVGTASI